MGKNTVELPVVPDKDLSEVLLVENNLLLYGTCKSNSIMARYKNYIPVSFENKAVIVCGRSFTEDSAAVFAIFPHPENPFCYVAVHGGIAPDSICWGSHLDMMLLPDYIIYTCGKLIEWGFWGNYWK